MDKTTYDQKMTEIRNRLQQITASDAAAAPKEPAGTNEPMATDRVRAVFANGGRFSAPEIIQQARRQGYRGTDIMLRRAIARMTEETNYLTSRNGKYERA